MRNFVKGPSDVDCNGANGTAGVHAGQPLMTEVGEEVCRTESGAKTELMLGEKALFFQVVHKGGVDHFLHYLWYDAQERHGSVVSHGWTGLLFMDGHDVCCFPQRWIDTLPEAGRKLAGQGWGQFSCTDLQHPRRDAVGAGSLGSALWYTDIWQSFFFLVVSWVLFDKTVTEYRVWRKVDLHGTAEDIRCYPQTPGW